jgi:hypothetical protein
VAAAYRPDAPTSAARVAQLPRAEPGLFDTPEPLGRPPASPPPASLRNQPAAGAGADADRKPAADASGQPAADGSGQPAASSPGLGYPDAVPAADPSLEQYRYYRSMYDYGPFNPGNIMLVRPHPHPCSLHCFYYPVW